MTADIAYWGHCNVDFLSQQVMRSGFTWSYVMFCGKTISG